MMPMTPFYESVSVGPGAVALISAGHVVALVIDGDRPGDRKRILASQFESYEEAARAFGWHGLLSIIDAAKRINTKTTH